MKKILTILLLGLAVMVQAQEIQCTVTINSDQIEGSNKQVFATLKTQIEEFMNHNRWTNMTYQEREKIDCQMMIIVNGVSDNIYQCSMQLQSRRPVYGTSYMTPVMNMQDKYFNFSYQEFDQLQYQQNQFSSNLTAMLTYYCYLVIGADMDTYQRLGGTPYYQLCEQIVNVCQTASMGDKEQTGWLRMTHTDSNKNRYAIVNNLLDEAFHPYREYLYQYHRLGLDEMSQNVANARARIAQGMKVLRDANRARPATYIVGLFLDAKVDEIVQIFTKGTSEEKQQVYDLLMDVDATRQNQYDRMNKQ